MKEFWTTILVAALVVCSVYAQTLADFNCGVDGQFCIGTCSYVVCTDGNKIPMPLPAGTLCTQTGTSITLNHDTSGVCVGIITVPTSEPTTQPSVTFEPSAGPTFTSTPEPTGTFTPTPMPTSTGGGSSVPSYVQIRSISQAGSGCPAGSVSQNVSPDKQAFTLAFTSFIAQFGPGLTASDTRKNCQINLDLIFPQGFSFAIADIDYRGFANLDTGVVGQQVSHYYFQGQLTTGSSSTQITGPSIGDYLRRDELGLAAVVWSPCGGGRSLNINTEVHVYATSAATSSSQGLMTVDSIDGTVQQIYNLRWRTC